MYPPNEWAPSYIFQLMYHNKRINQQIQICSSHYTYSFPFHLFINSLSPHLHSECDSGNHSPCEAIPLSEAPLVPSSVAPLLLLYLVFSYEDHQLYLVWILLLHSNQLFLWQSRRERNKWLSFAVLSRGMKLLAIPNLGHTKGRKNIQIK